MSSYIFQKRFLFLKTFGRTYSLASLAIMGTVKLVLVKVCLAPLDMHSVLNGSHVPYYTLLLSRPRMCPIKEPLISSGR